jgi:integrase
MPRPRPYRFIHEPTPGYFYFRRPGFPRVRLPGTYGSPEFAQAYLTCMGGGALLLSQPIGIERSIEGSFSALIASYYQSNAWLNPANLPDGLSEGTRKRRKPVIEKIRELYGRDDVAGTNAKHIKKILEDKSPAVQLDWMKALRALFRHAVDIEMRDDDPSSSVKVSRSKSKGFHTWTEQELEIYRAYWALGTEARLALELGLETASRRCEIRTLCRANIIPAISTKPARIMVARAKGSDDCNLPISAELNAAIEAMPVAIDPRTPFLPYSADTLGRKFAAWADEAGLPEHCRLHGLKKAHVRQAIEGGVAPTDGMAGTGHRNINVWLTYGKTYNKEAAADRAFAARRRRVG